MNATFESVVYKIINSGIRPLMILMFSFATLLFLWAILLYIRKPGGKVGDSAKTIGWGIVVLAAMFSVWGLVNVVVDFFDLPKNQTIDIPLFR